jgi:hypothetical protein
MEDRGSRKGSAPSPRAHADGTRMIRLGWDSPASPGPSIPISVHLIWICQVIVGVCRLESVATSFDFRLMIVNF